MQAEETCPLQRYPVDRLCRRMAQAIGSMVNHLAAGANPRLTGDCEAAALELLLSVREKALAVDPAARCAYCVKSIRRHVWQQVLAAEADWSKQMLSIECLHTPEGDPAEFADPAVDVFEQVLQRLAWKQRLPEHVADGIAQALDARERGVLGLYYFEGLTDREIALHLGLNSVQAANQIRTRALRRVREHLSGWGGVSAPVGIGLARKILEIDVEVLITLANRPSI